MKHLVIGAGEIGKSLQSIFECDIRDAESDLVGEYDILHIAYPYFVGFEQSVLDYKNQYGARYVVVHSTVPVGTCDSIGVAHSPVTGVHPHLVESIKTFTKFVSGAGAEDIVTEFNLYGIPAVYVVDSRNTEAGKLYGLLIYGINVLLEKEIYAYCKENNLDYDVVYRQFVQMYNTGYKAMNMDWAKMYELTHKDGGVGGHCVLQNAPLLGTDFAEVLTRLNDKYVV
jgi:hypothetical protein